MPASGWPRRVSPQSVVQAATERHEYLDAGYARQVLQQGADALIVADRGGAVTIASISSLTAAGSCGGGSRRNSTPVGHLAGLSHRFFCHARSNEGVCLSVAPPYGG